jgi:hypothetical protein
MWSDFGYDDDIPKVSDCDFNMKDSRKLQTKFGHNNHTLKNSRRSFGQIPWYTSGFK